MLHRFAVLREEEEWRRGRSGGEREREREDLRGSSGSIVTFAR